jgi:hypothetical protein
MQLRIATMLEVVGVAIGIVLLGIIGGAVTPKEGEVHHLTKKEVTPERVVERAQEGYQLDTCVRDISSHTVLSESVSGASEIIVLEGAPVTECFPGLEGFTETRVVNGEKSKSENVSQPKIFGGGDVVTSVTVLPRGASSSPVLGDSAASSSAVQAQKEDIPPLQATPAPSVQTIPSGGGGWTPSQSAIPTIDRFDACRIRIFGDAVPTTLTTEEQHAFETCLLEVAP